jgi:hypothetical protein
MNIDFFEKLDNTIVNNAILLIDASGSTKKIFDNEKTIMDKIEECISYISCDNFRIIFWNSDNEQTKKEFSNGIFKIPYITKKEKINQIFNMVKNKINNNCLTFPHLAFSQIPDEWISNTEITHIFYITDGQIGYKDISYIVLDSLKAKFKFEIEKLFKNFNNIKLHILTVESVSYNFNENETLNIAAGGDIYKIIQNNSLTKYISQFISYTPNNENGYKHINNIIVPKGFIPFGENYFSEQKINLFVKYLSKMIENIKDEDELLKIIQHLSLTITYLVIDKSVHTIDSIIKTFCNLFKNTTLDMLMINFILSDSIKSEMEGKAIIFSEYRSKLKELYKHANELLFQNTKKAININNNFITLPIDRKIIFGFENSVTETIKLNNNTYPNSSIKINNLIIPVLPFQINGISKINEQCLRQYIRAIISKQYNIGIYEDLIIFIVMGFMMQVVLSDVDEKYKNTFRNLANIMLNKKRTNSDITELENIESGALPIGDKIEKFYNNMNKVSSLLNINCNPLSTWYCLCLSFGNKAIINKQLIHCKESIIEDFGDTNILDNLKEITKISIHEMAIETILDYKCIITLEDIDTIGGFKFKSHKSLSEYDCTPIYVLSKTGYNSLIEQENCFCPICYVNLTKNDFEEVGPKNNLLMEIFSEDTKNPFGNKEIKQTVKVIPNNSSQKKIGTILIMKGTIGSGKTTIALEVQKKVEKLGYYCLNEGTDKYCKNIVDIGKAVNKISQILKDIDNLDHDKIFVIIDTCGEKTNIFNIFGKDFSSWKVIIWYPSYNKDKQKGYLSWSLRNVLEREPVNEESNYCLNPEKGIELCCNVHHKKALSLFGNNIIKISTSTNLEYILQEINESANDYSKYLNKKMTLEMQIEKIIDSL